MVQRTVVFLFAALFTLNSYGLPLPDIRTIPSELPLSFQTDYDFSGIVELSNCSGSLVRFIHSQDTDPAMVLTNGHCLETGMPPANTFVFGRSSTRRFGILNSKSQSLGSVRAKRIIYATMTGTDVALYELNETQGDIRRKYNVEPLILANQIPAIALPIQIISGYWHRGYSCSTEVIVNELREGQWTMFNSIRYSRPGCEIIGGTSGSPVIDPISRTVIGINNTMNEDGQMCTMNNPCEVDAQGRTSAVRGYGYAQQTYIIYTCLNSQRELDLQTPGCLLYH